MLVIGDSLELGSGPYLRGALSGTAVELDAERSRSSREVLGFSLGANDLSAATLSANLAAAQQLAGGRCMVVATIARPNRRGSSTAELNAALARGQLDSYVMSN